MRFKITTQNMYVGCKDEWEFEAEGLAELRGMIEERWGALPQGLSIECIEPPEEDGNSARKITKVDEALSLTVILLS